jgi:hypothetical protein
VEKDSQFVYEKIDVMKSSFSTVILNFADGIKTKGDPNGRRLFLVNIRSETEDKVEVVPQLWRGSSLKDVKEAAKTESAEQQKAAKKFFEAKIKVDHVLEIGTLR